MDADTPEALAQGAALFDDGEFYEAHEVWERAWSLARGELRALYQGLIQAAAAYHKLKVEQQRNGAKKLCDRALQTLAPVPDESHGVDVAAVRDALVELKAALDEGRAALPPPPTLNLEGAVFNSFGLRCPYCGEPVDVEAEQFGPPLEAYVEDCPVCCRPWQVRIERDGEAVEISLAREDD